MKKGILCLALLASFFQLPAQTNPAITSWIFNTTGLKGRHYVNGNSTPIQDNVLANVESVQYSADWSYIKANGIPAYITGPFLDGNPSVATAQTGYFKIPLHPVKTTGTPTNTTGGNIGAFINGVALFDYRDGVAWNPNTNALCGGPGNPACPGGPMTAQAWNRDAIPAERGGFDCAKAHPAMGNYHHHQNPSAFNLDLVVISNVCSLYPADGLYAINDLQHSPLIGFAYDGFPIYGAYGFKNTDGTGGIVRMKSSYKLRNITVRTHHADGTDVADGPPVSATYPLGYFREDYEYITTSPATSDYLDEHNGRFCVTPEYTQGIYAYFCTVNENWNSAYPYAVGPTFYGVKSASKVQTIGEPVTTYSPTTAVSEGNLEQLNIAIFPNPSGDFFAIQAGALLREKMDLRLYDLSGKLVQETEIQPGSTIGYLDAQTLYAGVYIVSCCVNGQVISNKKVVVE
ncbi:MAG: YHYH protein [Phycisphaerae bacterium]|nr:YHYH protein [Saprospiraceae bacterium]